MKLSIATLLSAIAFLSAATCNAADPVKDSMLSFQGITGVINTPSAHVNNEGSIHLLYSDQHDRFWINDRQKRQNNYLLSVGLFEFFELGGRVTEVPGKSVRDLSASIKVTSAPFTSGRPYWPVLAAGIQDLGGGANQLQSRYVVLSEDLWRFRFSAGYGFKSDRMKGGFGGVEFHAHEWVTLLGEYDSKDTNAGIRLVTPEIWKTPIQLTATLKSNLGHNPGTIDVAAGLTFPLDFRKKSPASQSDTSQDPHRPESKPVPPVTDNAPLRTSGMKPGAAPGSQVDQQVSAGSVTNTVSVSALENLGALRRLLENAGFIKVRVGQRKSRELVIEYENTIYNHNELDALGIVAGLAAETAGSNFETLHVIIKRKGLHMAAVSVPVPPLRAFMQGERSSGELRDILTFTYATGVVEDTSFLPDTEASLLPNTSLILAPGLQTFVATEAGMFNYLLSFRPEIISNPWNGGVVQLRWDIPLSWSADFDSGRAFRSLRKDPRMDRAMLFQGVNLAPGLMANLGAGMVFGDTYGTLNEITWSPFEGGHRFRGVQALARDTDVHRALETYLGSYRYSYSPLDLALEVTGGKFWGQDRGFSFELKRFFRDTAVSAFYKNTTTSEGKHWQAAGIQFAFPLTPAKDYKIGPLQVRGPDEWAYSQESTLAVGSQTTNNVLGQSLAINPQPTPALYRSYYNRDRLDAGYISQHIDRMREAWQRFKKADSH